MLRQRDFFHFLKILISNLACVCSYSNFVSNWKIQRIVQRILKLSSINTENFTDERKNNVVQESLLSAPSVYVSSKILNFKISLIFNACMVSTFIVR